MNITFDLTFYIVIILVIAVIVLAVIIFQLQTKMKKFLIGKDSENLAESLTSVDASLAKLGKFQNDMEIYLRTVEKRLQKSVQSVHTVRFNPFKGSGSGGNQSFATAFLNESGDGVVVSSLYAREHVSIFSKPVKNGASEYDLSDEEKEAVAGAMKGLK
jgi:hypothetical protein